MEELEDPRSGVFASLQRWFVTMLTDVPPRKRNRQFFAASDQNYSLALPSDDSLKKIAAEMEKAMKSGATREVRRACDGFLTIASAFYGVPPCSVRVLAARPLRVRERSTIELFGDYHPATKAIRVWMRTAIRKDITSFGTFLSTLCHEFCHHLDFHKFTFHDSWHTRGFYERAAILYHHSRGTPLKQLVWVPSGRQRWRIDWAKTNQGQYISW